MDKKEAMMKENKEKQDKLQQSLNEIKTTLRLLPIERRTLLMNFVIKEREHGVSYITDNMMRELTSGIMIYEQIDRLTAIKKPFFLQDMAMKDDYRRLIDENKRYPLYLDCFNGKSDEVMNKIYGYAKVLCSLDEKDINALADEVSKPDTHQEISRKKLQEEEILKMVLARHDKEYASNPYYKMMIDGDKGVVSPVSVEKKKISAGLKTFGIFLLAYSLTLAGVAIYSSIKNSADKPLEQSAPQVQKITEQKKLSPKDTSRGARAE